MERIIRRLPLVSSSTRSAVFKRAQGVTVSLQNFISREVIWACYSRALPITW